MTEHAKPPRALFLPWMMGHHFGVPFHRDLQRRVIVECLDLLATAERSGEIRTLPIPWPQVRREGIEIERRLGMRR